MSQSKRTYTQEFKNDAIRLALRSNSIKGVANDLGIPEGTLHTWIRATKPSVSTQDNAEIIDLSEEIKKLRNENARLKEEKEILKKAATFFAKEVSIR